jgi:hypothetical protein
MIRNTFKVRKPLHYPVINIRVVFIKQQKMCLDNDI